MSLNAWNHKMKIKTGDIVRVPNCGPRMTVEEVSTDTVRAVWFEGDDISGWSGPRRAVLAKGTLEICDEGQ